MKFDDYQLETKHDYIQSLFPLFTKGTADSDLLTERDLQKMKQSSIIHKNIIRAVNRMSSFYGYTIDTDKMTIERIEKIDRKIKGVYIGLYSEHNYLRITRIIKFLRIMGYFDIACLFLFGVCQDLKNPKFKNLAKGSLKFWADAIGATDYAYSDDEKQGMYRLYYPIVSNDYVFSYTDIKLLYDNDLSLLKKNLKSLSDKVKKVCEEYGLGANKVQIVGSNDNDRLLCLIDIPTSHGTPLGLYKSLPTPIDYRDLSVTKIVFINEFI